MTAPKQFRVVILRQGMRPVWVDSHPQPYAYNRRKGPFGRYDSEREARAMVRRVKSYWRGWMVKIEEAETPVVARQMTGEAA